MQAVSQLLAARVSVHVSDLSTPFVTKWHLLCVLLNPKDGCYGTYGTGNANANARVLISADARAKPFKAWFFTHAEVVAGIEASICRNGPSSAGFIPRDRIIQVKTTWQHACIELVCCSCRHTNVSMSFYACMYLYYSYEECFYELCCAKTAMHRGTRP